MPKEEWSFNGMNSYESRSPRSHSERGQTFVVIVVFIAVLLLGTLGLGTDYAQIWAHRQMAQGAADAACQAAAADVYLNAVDPAAQGTYGLDLSWVGSTFNWTGKPNSSPFNLAII